MTVATDRSDLGKELIVDMVKGMASLATNLGVLVQKVEDLTSALDDHRDDIKQAKEATKECEEALTDLNGLIDLILAATEEAGDMAEEEEREVTLFDFIASMKKMGKDEKETED